MTVASSTNPHQVYNATSKNCQCPGFNGKYHKCWHSSKAAHIENGGARNIDEARAARLARRQVERETAAAYIRMQYNTYDIY